MSCDNHPHAAKTILNRFGVAHHDCGCEAVAQIKTRGVSCTIGPVRERQTRREDVSIGRLMIEWRWKQRRKGLRDIGKDNLSAPEQRTTGPSTGAISGDPRVRLLATNNLQG